MGLRWIRFALVATFLLGACQSNGQSTPMPSSAKFDAHGDAGRSITARDLVEVTDIGSAFADAMSVSPDGRWILLQTQTALPDSNTYRLEWLVMEVETGDVRLVDTSNTPFMIVAGDGRPTGTLGASVLVWTKSSQTFAYNKREGELEQIWIGDAASGSSQLLFESDRALQNLRWGKSDHVLLIEAGRSKSQERDALREEGLIGYLLDVRFFPYSATIPYFAKCGAAPFVTSGEVAASQKCDLETLALDIKTKKATLVSAERRGDLERQSEFAKRPQFFANLDASVSAQSTDAEKFAWFENIDPEQYTGFLVPRVLKHANSDDETGAVACQREACRGLYLERAWWSDDDEQIVFLKSEGHKSGRHALYKWGPQTDDLQKLIDTPDRLSACQQVEMNLICLRESWFRPQRVVEIALSDGHERVLFDPNPSFSVKAFTRVEERHWQDEFGNDALGHLVYPSNYKAGERYPLVIVQYRSRGFLRGGIGDEMPIHPLAAAGFFVLSFDRPDDLDLRSRISFANADDYLEAERIEWKNLYERRRALSALETIVDQLQAEGLIDENRVSLTGLSDGAETVQFALVNSTYFSNAIASDLSWNPSLFYLGHETFTELLRQTVGHPEADPFGHWNAMTLGEHAEQIQSIPILVNVADSELTTSMYTVSELRANAHPIETHVFPQEYHIKWQPAHRYSIYRRNIQWLKFWLLGEEAIDPVSEDQYVRWRALRELHETNILKSMKSAAQ